MGVKDIGSNVRRHMKIHGVTISQLSTMTGLGTAAISNLLNGKSEPRSSTLIKIADALSVPFNAIIADAPQLNSLRFRTAKTLSGREKAERDQLKHDTAIWLSDYCFLEHEMNDTDQKNVFSDIVEINPSSAAGTAREICGIDNDKPICDISDLMEDAGIKLRIRPFGFKKTFGLSVGDADGGPAIVVNSEKGISIERQIFTIAHELGHLVLHKTSYQNCVEVENKEEEDEANAFAGAFLVPEAALKKEWEESRGLAFVDRVLKVKRIFKVSYKTILYRLFQIEEAPSYSDLIIRFRQDYFDRYGLDLKGYFEPDSLRAESPDLVAKEDPHGLDFSDLMEERFARFVRESYEREIISMSRAGEMLNLSIMEMRALVRTWKEL
ncbi:ImmA/IrrE family metallo-endopeptidase [uncultured Sphaerochaeta sp.]|uniref:ImmA/IrrE family metallo-endopeptidase n=1 Tax=uncultured Sphaerochaeta sp. TaxID=886478 RepID=UPI002AA84FF4|nr:ImmA/IrrE family metallo-endopeptidase [uncultured Sphaerochaeta sp.]